MSVLSDIQEDLHNGFFDTEMGLGENATYRFANGEEKEIIVVADVGNTRLPDEDRKNRAYLDALFTFKSEDIPKPRSGDKIIYHGKAYDYYSIHNQTMGTTTVRCVYGRTAVKFS